MASLRHNELSKSICQLNIMGPLQYKDAILPA